MSKPIRCHICRSGCTVTSASPGDGRRRFVCSNKACGNAWTEGKRPTEGYQR